MPTPYEIQVAIAALIKATVPDARVIGRNVLGELEIGNWSVLHDTTGKVHGWFVSQRADNWQELDSGPGYAGYVLEFDVWQVYRYESGNDTTNSEKEFADERELVKAAFTSGLPSELTWADPLTFPEIGLFPRQAQNRLPVHIAKGIGKVKLKTGANCP